MTSTLDTILLPTLERLRSLYAAHPRTCPGLLRKVVIKPGWTVVLGSGGQCGAALNFTGLEGAFGPPDLDAARIQIWIGKGLLELAGEALESVSWQERAIGVASLSALSQPFLTERALVSRGIENTDQDFAGSLRSEDTVALVGYGGMVSRLRGRCRELHVTDMRPRWEFQALVIADSIAYNPDWVQVHEPGDNEEILGKADAVAITGSSLVNGTFADLLGFARKARLVGVYGASAGFIPDVLFERGVHLVQAHRISDPERFEEGMLEEMSLEAVVQRTQTFLALRGAMA